MKKLFNLKKWFILGLGLLFIGFFVYVDMKNKGERNAISLIRDKIFNDATSSPINLVICYTPLQMVIAEKIIDQNPNEKFYTILISHTKNDTFEHYFHRLKNKSVRAYSFYFPKEKHGYKFVLTTLLELKIKSMLLPKINTIFLASIEKFESHTIISSYPQAKIKTFDDGTVNLIRNSQILTNSAVLRNIIYKKILNPVAVNKKTLRESSTRHFTIFKDLPNVMKDTLII